MDKNVRQEIPQASTHRGICTDAHPSFDTFDEMTAYAVSKGATHISLGNYHDGAFFRAKHLQRECSYCEILHFGARYDVKINLWATLLYHLHIKRPFAPNGWVKKFITPPEAGWYCHSEWRDGDIFPLKNNDAVYPFFAIGWKESERVNVYLENMRKIHDAPKRAG